MRSTHSARPRAGSPKKRACPKKKRGFYLPEPLLDRFNRRYHQLKLAGLPVENKSALLEAALGFALDDMDKEQSSRILKQFTRKP